MNGTRDERKLRLVVMDDSNDAYLELAPHKSAGETMTEIREGGGVWIRDRYIPYHSITQAWYEEG